MKRVYPRHISDSNELGRLLAAYLKTLFPAYGLDMRTLCYNARIPIHVLERLTLGSDDAGEADCISPEDYHTVFAHIMFRYPTLKIWDLGSGERFFSV